MPLNGLTPEEDAQLHARLSALAPLSAKTWRTLVGLGQRRELPKGGLFSAPGQPVTHFALVLKGLLRHFYVDAKGRESVKAFRGPFEVSAPYAELIQRKASRTHIEALTDTELCVFRVDAFEAAAKDSLELMRLARRFVEEHFVQKEQREYEFLMLSAEERYRHFCARLPDLLQHIPQHQVASYIGITPVALSRIRARARRGQ
ncbi:MAG: Crp/Fnr family transcriptional regulator [Myxococcota bacterium]